MNEPDGMGAHVVVSHVTKRFGGVTALDAVNMSALKGRVFGLIGPNGAGKSTLFKVISGQVKADTGTVTVSGVRIDKLPPHRRAELGVATVFQDARVFPTLSVFDNVLVGTHAWTKVSTAWSILGLRKARDLEREARATAASEIERLGLSEWADRRADRLPLGIQRSVQVARALAGRPHVLLLDEPAAGLRAGDRDKLVEIVKTLRSQQITVLLVEHDVSLVRQVADTLTVLEFGSVIAQGDPDAVLQDGRVIEAYLGGGRQASERSPER